MIQTITSSHFPRYLRLRAGINLIGSLLPDLEEHLVTRFQRTKNVPLKGTLELIDGGGDADIFKQGNKAGPNAIKIQRESLGLTQDEIIELVAKRRREYGELCSFFEDVPGLIMPETYIILNAPFLGLSAYAIVQPFVEEKLRCFFNDLTEAELINRIQSDPYLSLQFAGFARRVNQILEHNRYLDLLGQNNLSIVEGGGGSRLILVDPAYAKEKDLIQTSIGYSVLIQRLERINRVERSINIRTVKENI